MKNITCLIASTDAGIQEQVYAALAALPTTQYHFQFHYCESCTTALQFLRLYAIELVFIDFILPDGPALDWLRDVNRLGSLGIPPVGIVVLPVGLGQRQAMACLQAGAVEILFRAQLKLTDIQIATDRALRFFRLNSQVIQQTSKLHTQNLELIRLSEEVELESYQRTRTLLIQQRQLQAQINTHEVAENYLRTQVYLYQNILDTQSEMIFRTDACGRFLFANKALLDYLNLNSEQLISKFYQPIWVEADNEFILSRLNLLTPNAPSLTDRTKIYISSPQSKITTIEWTVLALFNPKGVIEGYQCVAKELSGVNFGYSFPLYKEITTKLENENELALRNEALIHTIIESIADVISIIDAEGNLLFESPGVENITGYAQGEIIGRNIAEFIHPADLNKVIHLILEGIKQPNTISKTEYRFRHKTGKWLYLESIGKNMLHEPAIRGIVVNTRDITEWKESNQLQAKLLAEKELLIYELQHRIKNNLQFILSLLTLTAQLIPEAGTQTFVQKTEPRIRALGNIYHHLYNGEKLEQFECAFFVQDLIGYLFQVYPQAANKIEVELDIKKTQCPIDAVVNCGLIINELLINCLTHAFPAPITKGKITIRLQQVGSIKILSVQDNGIGLPPNFVLESTPTLGLQLVKMLVDELSGKLRIINQAGCLVEIQF